MKKKFFNVFALIMVLVFTVVSCGEKKEEKKQDTQVKQEVKKEDGVIRVAAIKGPPAMGLVKLFADNEEGKTLNKYDTKIVNTPDEIAALVGKGEVDIASIPSNLASVLYNKTGGKIQTASIIAFGILYIVENGGETVKSVKDLKGKTIYLNSKGSTPEVVLNYVLKGNGLEPGKDVKLEFKSEAAEVVSAISNDPKGIALLPQPFVTVAQAKNPNLRVAFALADEWDKVPGTKKGSQVAGVIAFNKEFAEKNPEKVANFLKEYEQSVKYLNENVDEGAKLLGKYNIIPEPRAKKAIPATKVTFVAGEEMKEKISEYLRILHEGNPKIIGGKIPGDDFYYIQKK